MRSWLVMNSNHENCGGIMMTNSVIKLVQAIEADYGMDSKLWSEMIPD